MVLEVFHNNQNFRFEADGRIGRVESNKDKEYVVAIFTSQLLGVVLGLQKGLVKGVDTCVVRDGDTVVKGVYWMSSSIDGNPVIAVEEFIKNDKISKGVRGEYGIIEHFHETKK